MAQTWQHGGGREQGERMTIPDLPVVTLFVLDAFESLKIPYRIGGSLASSAMGVPRASIDADLVADVRNEHADPLAARLQPAFYASPKMIREAIRNRGSFNLLHIASGFKVDVFVVKERPFDRQAFARCTVRPWLGTSDRTVAFSTAEDVILYKLEWYRMGDEASQRQWNDVIGVLRVQGEKLDRGYMQTWAAALKVGDLLQRAIDESRT
jgi:hypothetical protein